MQKSLTSVSPRANKYGIMLKDSGESGESRMIGVLGSKGETENGGEAEMDYILHRDYWKKGYVTEALVSFAGHEGVYWGLDGMFTFATLLFISGEDLYVY